MRKVFVIIWGMALLAIALIILKPPYTNGQRGSFFESSSWASPPPRPLWEPFKRVTASAPSPLIAEMQMPKLGDEAVVFILEPEFIAFGKPNVERYRFSASRNRLERLTGGRVKRDEWGYVPRTLIAADDASMSRAAELYRWPAVFELRDTPEFLIADVAGGYTRANGAYLYLTQSKDDNGKPLWQIRIVRYLSGGRWQPLSFTFNDYGVLTPGDATGDPIQASKGDLVAPIPRDRRDEIRWPSFEDENRREREHDARFFGNPPPQLPDVDWFWVKVQCGAVFIVATIISTVVAIHAAAFIATRRTPSRTAE